MLTLSMMKKEFAKLAGVYEDSPEVLDAVRDFNDGNKKFLSGGRRYWTRREKKTNLVKDKQFYQFPSDMLRVSEVRIKSAGSDWYKPLVEIRSEKDWNGLNSGHGGSGQARFFFVKGSDEIGLYPVPSENVVDGMKVSYEPRLEDMKMDDIELSGKFVSASPTVEIVGDGEFPKYVTNNFYITVKDGRDGNWYRVNKWIDSKKIMMENGYEGHDEDSVDFICGQCPIYPEEYHMAPVYYALWKFFMMRKDVDMVGMYKGEYREMFEDYRKNYGIKTTSGVIHPKDRIRGFGIEDFILREGD